MNDKVQSNLPVGLPQDLLEKYRKVDQEFLGGLYQTDPNKAFSLWNDLYQEVLEKQPKGRRYHKGGEVHNMGICKLLLMSPLDSLNYFMLGFIEDILSTTTESGSTPDNAPGAQNLRNIFKLSDEEFRLIKTFVQMTESEIGVIQNPQIVLDEIDKTGAKKPLERVARNFHPTIKPGINLISKIPGDWNNRVFIGGDYVNYFYVINMLKPLVESKKYAPIIAYEFGKPDEMSIREHALLLLHNCKYAIFDISGRGGHLMEIERTYDYQTKTFYICLDGQQPTAMLSHIKDKVIYFKDVDQDLPRKIRDLFSSLDT